MDVTLLTWFIWGISLLLLVGLLWMRQRQISDLTRERVQQAEQLAQLLSDIQSISRASKRGNLDVRIEEGRSRGDYLTIARMINDSLDSNVGIFREVGRTLDKLATGDFSAQITTSMAGDYQILQEATNRLGMSLNWLIQDSNLMNRAAVRGELDVRIDVSRYRGDFSKITNGINDTMEVTVKVLREIASSLGRLSSGDFSAQVNAEMRGDYLVLKQAVNDLGDNLNNLIADSDLMNLAAVKGALDIRIDTKKYKGDFSKITNGINDTMNTTVSILREIGGNLDRLSSGDFSAQVTSNMMGDYQILRQATNKLGTNLNNLIIDSNMMNLSAEKGSLDVRIDASKYQGDFSKITNGINNTMTATVSVLREVGDSLGRLATGDFTARVESDMRGDYEMLKKASNQLSASLLSYDKIKNDQAWIQEGLAHLSSSLARVESFKELMQVAISIVARYVSAGKGVIYFYDLFDQRLVLMGTYAFVERSALGDKFKLGEGVIGQVAVDRQPILLRHLPRSEGLIMTGTTVDAPLNTYTYPLVYKDTLVGVIELASSDWFDDTKQDFLKQSVEMLAVSIFSAQKADETRTLLMQTQQQAEQLETQAREVELQNAELEQQKQETERQSRELEVAQRSLQQQNDELILAQQALETRAKELAASNKYKGEFLANMTHELRTPLNAINVLAGLLKKNGDNNLTPKQVEHLNVIYYAGTDLLNLINDLLDLSRIEAGQMSVSLEVLDTTELVDDIKGMFSPLVQEKGLALSLQVEKDIPHIQNDKAKLRQIIKNLMSNAVKFTDKGGVILSVVHGKTSNYPVEIQVIDTGCGIPHEKLEEIFESFRQVDGSTTRKFGGTGLGLAISRQLANMLGCEIHVTSELNKGSVFSLLLPLKVPLTHLDKSLIEEISSLPVIPDHETMNHKVSHRQEHNSILTIGQEDVVEAIIPNALTQAHSVLVVDDDPVFMSIIESQLSDLGYRVFRAENGRDAMMMAKKYQPDGILLDRRLPTISGDEVLKLLKRDPQTRHIPVKMISVDEPDLGLRRDGALSVIQKPIDLPQLKIIMNNLLLHSTHQQGQEVLLIEDDQALQTAIVEVMQSCLPDAKLSYFHDAHKALNYLTHVQPSIVIVDLGLPNIDGFDVIDQITRRYSDLPIIVYTGRELTAEQLKRLRLYADSVILKTSDSIRRLIDEVGLFMHRSMQACQDKVDMLDSPSDSLSGVEVLLVDDDIRNLFSLKALLESSGMKIFTAHNGADALQVLSRHQNIRMVLTDIMMPEMDGYELITAIRSNPELAQLPVIALTAKVGTDEREKCIKVGADDYLTKPVEESMLLALLRVWVSQTRL